MPTLTEQYTEMVQQSQDAVRAAVDNWTKTVQQAIGQLPTTATPFDANQVVDQVFDLAEKVLKAQRDFAKNLISTSTAVGEAVAARATEAADVATEATKAATKAAAGKKA
jgi:hypothetical protein